MRFFLVLALTFCQYDCLAQAIDPSTLAAVKSEQIFILHKPFSYSTHENVPVTYELQAGPYQAELSGELGTFYRGSEDCLSKTSSTRITGLMGGGIDRASKYDCGILLLKTGGALIYFYENDKVSRHLRGAAGCSSCGQAVRRLRKVAERQVGKIFFPASMKPSMQLESNLTRP